MVPGFVWAEGGRTFNSQTKTVCRQVPAPQSLLFLFLFLQPERKEH